MKGGATPLWPTTSAANYGLPTADLIVTDHAFETINWSKKQKSWLAQFPKTSSMLLRRTTGPAISHIRFMVFCDVAGHVLIAAPTGDSHPCVELNSCFRVKLDGCDEFANATDGLVTIVVDKFEGFKATPYRWVSPQEFLSRNCSCDDFGVMEQTGPERPALLVAAEACFDIVAKHTLEEFVEFYEIGKPNKKPRLYALCAHLVWWDHNRYGVKLDDVVLAKIMARRKFRNDHRPDMFELTTSAGLLDKADAKALTNIAEQEEEEAEEQKYFRNDLQSLHKKVKPRLSFCSNRPPHQRRGSQLRCVVRDIYVNHKGPMVPGTDSFGKREVRQLCPARTLVYRDSKHCRWLMRRGDRTRSRAWVLYGYRESLRLLLQWSWMQQCDEDGVELLDCLVQDVFEPRSGNMNVDSKRIAGIRNVVIL